MELQKLLIGDRLCSRFDLQLNENNVPEIQADGWENLDCKSAFDMDVGYK
jgi:hypothetical protein